MNINEIAKLANVSRATVSRYFNDGYVSAEKREQIRRVIEETGYKPSAQAQMLRTKKTKQIGVIIPKINSESISGMISGISKELKQAGFWLLLANTENQEREEVEYLKLFFRKSGGRDYPDRDDFHTGAQACTARAAGSGRGAGTEAGRLQLRLSG